MSRGVYHQNLARHYISTVPFFVKITRRPWVEPARDAVTMRGQLCRVIRRCTRVISWGRWFEAARVTKESARSRLVGSTIRNRRSFLQLFIPLQNSNGLL